MVEAPSAIAPGIKKLISTLIAVGAARDPLPAEIVREDRLVGIVSLADISRSEQSDAAAVALGGVTDPGDEHNQASDKESKAR